MVVVPLRTTEPGGYGRAWAARMLTCDGVPVIVMVPLEPTLVSSIVTSFMS